MKHELIESKFIAKELTKIFSEKGLIKEGHEECVIKAFAESFSLIQTNARLHELERVMQLEVQSGAKVFNCEWISKQQIQSLITELESQEKKEGEKV